MLNRRHLRIKVLQSLYAFYQSKSDEYSKLEKDVFNSVERIYDLYLYLLLTFSELKNQAERRIEENKKKILPTQEDLNPSLKFVENRIITLLESNEILRKVSETRRINWLGDQNQEIFRLSLIHI